MQGNSDMSQRMMRARVAFQVSLGIPHALHCQLSHVQCVLLCHIITAVALRHVQARSRAGMQWKAGLRFCIAVLGVARPVLSLVQAITVGLMAGSAGLYTFTQPK